MTDTAPLHFDTRVEWREARRPVMDRIEANARAALKPGDRLRVGRCGGTKINVRMTGWDGHWITSATYSDLAPCSIDRVNGKPVSFVDEADRALFETPPPPIEDRRPRVRFSPWDGFIHITAHRTGETACAIMPEDVGTLLRQLIAAEADAGALGTYTGIAIDDEDLPF
ncbi:hypothetical protein ACFQ15_05615 [Sphingomonas hankookensis]|uniref:hypothetical protein n=1 Tax=Sphingomonas hankookensis TaxID=563996 RepID=UPI001F563D09|nr:hypothetical protein [Sphingomonas hankookensis]